MPTEPVSRAVKLHGLSIRPLDLTALLDEILQASLKPEYLRQGPMTIAYANAHSCNLASEHPEYRAAMEQIDLVYLDGNGPRLAAWLAGHPLPPRLTAPDWFDSLCARASLKGISFYFLGGNPGVAEAAARVLQRRHSNLSIVGHEDGYFDSQDAEGVIQRVNRAQPGILVIGMGSPKQELWMIEHRDQLDIPVIWTAGGLLDYLSGRIPRAPYWTRALGVEWLGRFLLEPRRLSGRYLRGIPIFLFRSAAYILRQRLAGPGGEPGS